MGANPLSTVHIATVQPPGAYVNLQLWDDTTYEAAGSGSSGGWQIVDRPRLVASTQWYDRSPWSLVGHAVLDSYSLYNNNTTSIEPQCLLMESWMDKIPGTLQPAVLSISGPVPGIQRQWILYKVSYGKAIRNQEAGYRVQQEMDLTFYEYNSSLVTAGGTPSPAQQALQAAGQSQSYILYTAVQGDTLVTIAAKLLKNWTLWTELSVLNGMRDPNDVYPGQTIKIPQS